MSRRCAVHVAKPAHIVPSKGRCRTLGAALSCPKGKAMVDGDPEIEDPVGFSTDLYRRSVRPLPAPAGSRHQRLPYRPRLAPAVWSELLVRRRRIIGRGNSNLTSDVAFARLLFSGYRKTETTSVGLPARHVCIGSANVHWKSVGHRQCGLRFHPKRRHNK